VGETTTLLRVCAENGTKVWRRVAASRRRLVEAEPSDGFGDASVDELRKPMARCLRLH